MGFHLHSSLILPLIFATLTVSMAAEMLVQATSRRILLEQHILPTFPPVLTNPTLPAPELPRLPTIELPLPHIPTLPKPVLRPLPEFPLPLPVITRPVEPPITNSPKLEEPAVVVPELPIFPKPESPSLPKPEVPRLPELHNPPQLPNPLNPTFPGLDENIPQRTASP
ncbi:hypothetical protein GIB67_019626 [Kingdonia uniflora]|uniref:Uncharacterized protein n=1 Tax=Kingdonia uniflora TaxID=39325 RepID=A0A7J7LND3_9MAGN|nr:hypothetical protein GIB67_001854 [Kingdonia uniflora]KAF6160686.1 hypothetical protein GIB67_019626 [Kingdonia uniflora]